MINNEAIQIFVINLDAQEDRWNNCVQQQQRFGLNLKRVSAVTPEQLSRETTHYVTNGVRAVWESHMECLRLLINSGSKCALIMEDDFVIHNHKRLLKYIRDSKVLQFDLVQLGFLKPGLDTRVKVLIANIETSIFRFVALISQPPFSLHGKTSERLRVREARQLPPGFTADDFQPGAHCYLISRNLADAVLNLNNPQFLSIDDFFTSLSQMRSFKSMRVRRSLVGQAPFAKWEGQRFLS